ncbi:336_t:CDS:2, partial [Racocetra persica]
DIKTYDDGTILVHIIRNESTPSVNCSKIGGMSLEQKLRIRLIFLNGTVKEIDPKLKLDPINSINYLNPITIYPLQKPYILVTYVNTNDSSNLTSYEECGEVIDWDGISRSTIQLNANRKFGFIRFVQESYDVWGSYAQYSIDDNGNLTNLTGYAYLNPIVSDHSMKLSLMSIVSTFDSGYLAILNYTQDSIGGLCTKFISYNQTINNVEPPVIIYQITQPNTIIISVDCDKPTRYIRCIASIRNNNTTKYVVITLYSSGKIFRSDIIDLSQQDFRAKIMTFNDDYILG